MIDTGEDSGYNVVEYPSLSSGLRFKVLNLPPSFYLDHQCKMRAANNEAYVFVGARRRRSENLRLGLLPIRDKDAPRTANFITAVEDHKIWNVGEG